jgi:hypothetical protein
MSLHAIGTRLCLQYLINLHIVAFHEHLWAP